MRLRHASGTSSSPTDDGQPELASRRPVLFATPQKSCLSNRGGHWYNEVGLLMATSGAPKWGDCQWGVGHPTWMTQKDHTDCNESWIME